LIARLVPRLSAAELGRFLIAPDAGEQLSPLAGPGALVLDLAATSSAQAEQWGGPLLDQLRELPCVTIAIEGEARDGSTRALALACDVVVAGPSELDSLLAGFEKTPISALAFVQLLRTSSTTSSYAGLVAESFVYSTLQSGTEFQAWLAERRQRPAERSAMEGPACRLERDRGRLEISLSRPGKKNAFSRSMRDELVEALQLALADPSIEEVVLRGDGDSFCSGGDLDEFGCLSNPAEAHAIRTTRSPAMLIARLAHRVRVEVHGACIGAGAELPAFADRVVAAEGSFFQLPEVGLGLIPGAGGTVSLPRRIGRQRTAWLGLSGSRLDAQTALAWGLVDEVRLGQHV
jgi:enoyl-CoA hydratase/carnithine racemase